MSGLRDDLRRSHCALVLLVLAGLVGMHGLAGSDGMTVGAMPATATMAGTTGAATMPIAEPAHAVPQRGVTAAAPYDCGMNHGMCEAVLPDAAHIESAALVALTSVGTSSAETGRTQVAAPASRGPPTPAPQDLGVSRT